ncbi:hypothetical protein [Pseudomonas moraviensis]|uniref:hypothetical protein n=1 Tax=Pseudomonas moraviensis TaxID=321662 RepID=UPI00093802A3|nr:hypothetical protein [Pseudomonas moraviensis]OJT50071.1 hypothetical protein BSZ28_18760 [Pseudomonas moraviensis]
MTYLNAHSPVWGNAEHTIVNLMATFEWLSEEVSFTATPYDVEEYGRELFQRAIDGDFGVIAEFVPPPQSIGQLIAIEDAWKASEMDLIADQLIAIEDSDPSALLGTERQWRDYRTLVRAWKEGAEHFPDQAFRPVRPA